jgi:hypothetical protein
MSPDRARTSSSIEAIALAGVEAFGRRTDCEAGRFAIAEPGIKVRVAALIIA